MSWHIRWCKKNNYIEYTEKRWPNGSRNLSFHACYLVCCVSLLSLFVMQPPLKCATANWMRRGQCGTECEPTLSFLLALNFFRHSTVSCLCIMDATVDRCWEKEEQKEKGGEKSIKINKKSVHQGVCVRFVRALFRWDERWGISLWLDVQENERLSGCWCGDTYADPWMLEGLLSCDPLGWIDGQHLVDQVFGLWSDCVPLWGGELKRPTEPHLNIHC